KSGHYSWGVPPSYVLHPRKTPFVDADITPPIGNLFVYNLPHMDENATFFGGSLAVNYHYRPRKFLSIGVGAGYVTPLHWRYRYYNDSGAAAVNKVPPFHELSYWSMDVTDNWS